MSRKLKKMPLLKTESQLFDFWSSHDVTEYMDMSKAARARFPNLKLSSQSISLRLPLTMLEDIKIMANRRDVPYQSMMKIILADAIKRENQTV